MPQNEFNMPKNKQNVQKDALNFIIENLGDIYSDDDWDWWWNECLISNANYNYHCNFKYILMEN